MKKRVRKKFNFRKFIIFIIFIIMIYFGINYICSIKTKNIIILNNSYYTDDDIIYAANIESYPKFILLNKQTIKNKIKKLDLIEDVIIHKKFGFILEIDIKEYKPLYLKRSTNKYILSNGIELDNNMDLNVPILINYVPSDVEEKFISTFSEIDSNIIEKISEIEYSKTDYDDKRFLLYMSDGNEVYINTVRMDLLNKYVTILSTIGNKKGILYLDNGNYFEIKEE